MIRAEVRNSIEKQGLPGQDLFALPGSAESFPDNAGCRLETTGIERTSTAIPLDTHPIFLDSCGGTFNACKPPARQFLSPGKTDSCCSGGKR